MNRTWIPNAITLVSLFCGALGALFAARAMVTASAGPDWYLATLSIAMAGLFDGLDGRFARILNAGSNMGKQLDSLTDMVSMSLAPALLIYQRAFAHDRLNVFWMVVTALFVCCGAARLARFNLEPGPGRGYTGMPTSAACAALCGLAVLAPRLGTGVVAVLFISMGLLMISRLPFPTPEQCLLDAPIPLRIAFAVVFVLGAYGGWYWFFGMPLVYIGYALLLNAVGMLRLWFSRLLS